MAVVAVEPLAIGMKYSVCEFGNSLTGNVGAGLGIQTLRSALALALACANNASFDWRPFGCESVGDICDRAGDGSCDWSEEDALLR